MSDQSRETVGKVVPVGYKQTEVGVIPEDWKATTVGQVTSWLSGGTPNRKREDYWQGDIPWISGSTLKTLELETSDQFLTSEGVEAGSKMAPLDATLLLVRGSALHSEIRAGLVVAPLCFNQDVKALIPNKNIVPRYLTIYLLAMESELLKLVSSAGNSAGVLDTELVKNFKFLQPPKHEQTAIANALSDVDALISEQEKLIAKKQAIKTATMQQLLTGRTRLPQFALREDGTAKGTKTSELGEIPEDWGVVTLSDIGQTVIGLTYSPNDVADFGTLVLRSSNVQSGKLAYADNVYVNMELPERVIVKQGDILICVRNGSRQLIGKCALIDENAEGSTFGAFMSIFRTKYSVFAFYQFQSDLIQNQINEIMGATINQITNKDMSGFKITLPSDEKEQTAIATILSNMDAEIQALEQRLGKTRQIKQGMMQELLTGKTRLVKPESAV